ncbi:unnamed protein product, partial [marine sediment metagenome]
GPPQTGKLCAIPAKHDDLVMSLHVVLAELLGMTSDVHEDQNGLAADWLDPGA